MGYLKNEQSLQGCEAYFYNRDSDLSNFEFQGESTVGRVTDMENRITNKWRKPLSV